MDRYEVADALEEIALYLEFLGENPFKSRAYLNGAQVLRTVDGDLSQLVAARSLGELKGIGPALAEKITTLVTTGGLPYLDTLRSDVPRELLAWTRVPGLGPKRARAIHQALGIRTLEELAEACRADQLRDLPGLGPSTQAKILEGITGVNRRAGRFLMPVVHAEARRLLQAVRAIPGVLRAEVAGSVRRFNETVHDIDLVVSADDPPAVVDAFARVPGVREVTGRGPARCAAKLAQGPTADLWVVPAPSFGAALVRFTGSEEHTAALATRARDLGLAFGDDGSLRHEDGASLPTPEESDVYGALGLAWIPPELRESRGEIEAARTGSLPRLLERADLQGVLHVHSEWSDGRVSIREMAEAARRLGFRYLGLCDHSQLAAYAGGLDEAAVRAQAAEVDALNRDFDDGFRILKGIEVDILPDGALDFPHEVLAGFDLVVASVHSRFNLSEREQTARVLRALDDPYVDMLGHPTGRLLLARDPYALDLDRVLEAAADRGVAVEVNAHPNRLELDWRELRNGLKRGLKTSVNPDAHTTAELHGVDFGTGIARKGWCTADDVLNAWPLARLSEHLAARRRNALAGRARVRT